MISLLIVVVIVDVTVYAIAVVAAYQDLVQVFLCCFWYFLVSCFEDVAVSDVIVVAICDTVMWLCS